MRLRVRSSPAPLGGFALIDPRGAEPAQDALGVAAPLGRQHPLASKPDSSPVEVLGKRVASLAVRPSLRATRRTRDLDRTSTSLVRLWRLLALRQAGISGRVGRAGLCSGCRQGPRLGVWAATRTAAREPVWVVRFVPDSTTKRASLSSATRGSTLFRGSSRSVLNSCRV